MIENVSGGSPGTVEYDCEYFWCDNATQCSTDATKYQKKKRLKEVRNNTTFTNCRTYLTAIDTTDTNSGCCFCKMEDPPGWP